MIAAAAVSYSQRFADLAAREPEKCVLIIVASDGSERVVRWRELEASANQMARLLLARGVSNASLVVIRLPATLEHLALTLGAWRIGACVLPLNPEMVQAEFISVLDTARRWRNTFVASDLQESLPSDVPQFDLSGAPNFDATRLAHEVVPNPGKAVTSGGSTGRPKIIIDPKPWTHYPGAWGQMNRMGMKPNQVQLLVARLHHNLGANFAYTGLFENHTLVIPEKFQAAQCLDLIARHRVNFIGMLPIMMQRMLNVPDVRKRDVSSIESLFHVGSACPEWVKRGWIELIGAQKVWESYGTTESKGFTMIRGDDWLKHPGSTGKPSDSEFRIVDEHQRSVAPGVIGEIYMRLIDTGVPTWPMEPTYQYVGAEPCKEDADGFSSVGDLGYIDAAGYLFIADRRVDMIISGGINIYPAEIEAVLSVQPDIEDAVIVGVPDPDWGHRVHAIVQVKADRQAPAIETLDRFCRARLTNFKVPKSYEFVEVMPRDSSGKIRRLALSKRSTESAE